MSEPTENNKYIAWAVWIPVATAALYFYCWVFEYVSCTALHIPTNLIEPTTGTILFYAGNVVVFTSILGLILTSLYISLRDAKLIFGAFSFFGLITVFNIFYIINNFETSWEVFFRMTKYAIYFWIPLFIFGLFIHFFGNRKTWDKIFDFTFVDGKDVLSSLIKRRRKFYLSAVIIVLLLISWGTGWLSIQLNPPNQRIVGKEPLIFIKKYNDIVICAYLDTVHNRLKDTIKVIKLDGGESLTLKPVDPAPSLPQ
ncbi:hypothetical protein HDF24_22750 [Mucilaginibacter sp. X4EP1]|uniref:hypothetical protein n=1 Tax=Mucilaginibacter sp. X4EP1 TaxID=2723092 RepID=UPI0021687823|nr:hypothetical protein [Mucilaginibacter sp. X4EP1]MCS3816458.1 hypothetical protein [Mucilaginibacter sp. X4EP1]